MNPDAADRFGYFNASGNAYSIDKQALTSYLSQTYGIDESILQEHIDIAEELLEIQRADKFFGRPELIAPPPPSWDTGALRPSVLSPRDHEKAYLHIGITADRVRMKTGKNQTRYPNLREFLEQFPQIILFVVPIFGAFEFSNDILTIQTALKRFAEEFGRSVANDVLVIDYWVKGDFDYKQYREQEQGVMRKFKVGKRSVPCLLVSNRSPYAWDAEDNDKKMVILKFRNFGLSEISPRLLRIAEDLEKQDLPSVWLHDWQRLINWAKSKGIGTKAVGIALKAAKLGV